MENTCTIEELKQWIEENPTYIDGVLERLRKIKQFEENKE